ncbi:HAD family phosphatase, partial [candidate division KSB1 bacterium]|nr:HAD family phosphatase [candidate division KSB1 bacterium]
MKKKAFLFDLDGTLVDNMRAVQEGFFAIVKQLGGDVDERFRTKMSDMLGGIYAHPHKRLLEVKLIWNGGRLLEFGFYRRLKMIYRAYMELRDISFQAPLFSDTISTLSHLKKNGYKLALVTMRKKKYIFKENLMHPLKHFFDAVVARQDTANLKPHPAPVLEA